jgi:dihydroorotase
MSRIIINNALIIQPGNKLHRQKRSILIEDGQIKEISEKIDYPETAEIIEGENLHISMGFFDMSCRIPDPGFEYREDFSIKL